MQTEPEPEEGNIEYKYILINKSEERINELASQMKYRVNEGNGESIYFLGIKDDGNILGITETEYQKSFKTLEKASHINNFAINLINKKLVANDKYFYELLIREINITNYSEIKVSVAGNVDSGKSSFLGVITKGILDNGRGLSRSTIFNFKHELNSGRTSSIAHHILGFDAWGKEVNYRDNNTTLSWPQIIEKSNKIITFYDLAGHEKYLKTTITGLSSSFSHMCFIMIGGNMGVSKITKEHIFLCLSLKIPFSIIITKLDICKNRKNILLETINEIKRIIKLPSIRKIAYMINNEEDSTIASKNFYNDSIIPIFKISNVTGLGINLIKNFLNLLSPPKKNNTDNLIEFYIDTIFIVSGIGNVIGGHLNMGSISVNDKLLLGPLSDGSYIPIQIRSIHVKRVPVNTVNTRTYVCLGIKKINRNLIRKGQVIISTKNEQLAIKQFDAKINVLRSHSTTIKIGYEPVLHSNNIRQTVKLIDIFQNNKILRTGDSATVRFKFCYRPEYIKPNDQILFCEGRVKISGTVNSI